VATDTVFTGGEWDMFLTLPPLLGRSVRSALMLGNAGGTTARAFGVLYPQVAFDGVELDPRSRPSRGATSGSTTIAAHVYTADARPFLQPAPNATT